MKTVPAAIRAPRNARMADYLPRVNGMPDIGQERGWTAWNWRRTPVQRVAVARLWATQDYLSPGRIDHYLRSGKRRSDGLLPCLVALQGRVFIAEGHHRIVAAVLRGEDHVDGHVKRIEVPR